MPDEQSATQKRDWIVELQHVMEDDEELVDHSLEEDIQILLRNHVVVAVAHRTDNSAVAVPDDDADDEEEDDGHENDDQIEALDGDNDWYNWFDQAVVLLVVTGYFPRVLAEWAKAFPLKHPPWHVAAAVDHFHHCYCCFEP